MLRAGVKRLSAIVDYLRNLANQSQGSFCCMCVCLRLYMVENKEILLTKGWHCLFGLGRNI